jgi:type II secretory pathway component PulF
MPTYSVKIIDHAGSRRSLREVAPDEATLRAQLRSRGIWPVTVQELGVSVAPSRLALPNRELIALLQQLDLQLRAGVTADVAFAQLAEDAAPGPMQNLLTHLHREIQRGRPIHEACRHFPRVFPAHVAAIIAAGEASAQLPASLRALTAHLSSVDELHRTARRALVYPVVVLTATGGLVIFLVGGIVPKFAEIFASVRIPLPGATVALIKASQVVHDHWAWLLVGGVAGVAGVWFASRQPRAKAALESLVLRLPVLGETLRSLATARFAAHFKLLLNAGIPLMDALVTGAELTGNSLLSRDLLAARAKVAAGRPFYASLSRQGGFPAFVFPALKAGETTGQLGEALTHIEQYAAARARESLATGLALLEPLLLAGLTGVVGFIALSFFLPIFSLLGGINGR